MSKKIIAIIFSFVLLTSCGGEEKEPIENSPNNGEQLAEIKNGGNVEYNFSGDDNSLQKQRSEIKIEDLNKLFYNVNKGIKTEGKNELENIGVKFISNLNNFSGKKMTQNIEGGITKEYLDNEISKLSENIVRNFDLMLNITDYKTKEKINKGLVYVNGVKIGEFNDGSFTGSFKWPKGIELFNITVRSPNYGDGFITLNSLNSMGGLLYGDVILKKATNFKVDLSKPQRLENTDFIIKMPACTMVDDKGECFNGNAEIKIAFFSGSNANNNETSLNMLNAITDKGELTYLISGGMAFIDVVDSNGNILNVGDGKSVDIGYKIDAKSAEYYETYEEGKVGEHEGYWYYNKEASIWEERNVENYYDAKDKIWYVKAEDIY